MLARPVRHRARGPARDGGHSRACDSRPYHPTRKYLCSGGCGAGKLASGRVAGPRPGRKEQCSAAHVPDGARCPARSTVRSRLGRGGHERPPARHDYRTFKLPAPLRCGAPRAGREPDSEIRGSRLSCRRFFAPCGRRRTRSVSLQEAARARGNAGRGPEASSCCPGPPWLPNECAAGRRGLIFPHRAGAASRDGRQGS